MKPFPNRTSIFQRIRLSIAQALPASDRVFSFRQNSFSAGSSATVVLRLVNDVIVSLDGHYSIDYYDHSASNRD
jgi:hypothetical protein